MVWFQIDDKLWLHPKTLKAGNEAIGLWARAGSHCMSYLTNGHIDEATVSLLAAPSNGKELAQRLVDAGLWHHAEGGYIFHDWEHNQRTREQVKAERDAARERQRRYRQRSAQGVDNAVSNAVTDAVSHGAHTKPSHAIEEPPADELATKRVSKVKQIDEAFDRWYKVYPRKQGKADARKAFGQLMTKGALPDIETLIERTKRYAAMQTDPTYTKLPAGWLRSGRYEDDDLAAPAAKQSEGTSQLGTWLEARGSSLEEYERRKGEPGWLDGLKGMNA